MRVNITLEHKESGERLYLTSKNKRNTPDRLQLKKYSPKLRKHVIFTEVKQGFNTNQYKRKTLISSVFSFCQMRYIALNFNSNSTFFSTFFRKTWFDTV